MIERNTVDSLFLPGINGSYMTVISEDRNDLFNLLPGVSRLQCREPGSLPELRQSLERSRWLEFMEQTESTTKRSIPQVCRGFPWSLQQSSNQYMCTGKNTIRDRAEQHLEFTQGQSLHSLVPTSRVERP